MATIAARGKQKQRFQGEKSYLHTGCVGDRVCGVATHELKSPYVCPTLGFDINSIWHLYWFGEMSFRGGITRTVGRIADEASYPCGARTAFIEYH